MPVTIEACLACARSGALPGCHQTAPVLNGIVQGLRPDDYGLTVTTLIGCLRKWRLMQDTAYWLKPAQSYWAYRGQLLHGVAAHYAADDPHAIAEQRFTITIDLPDGRSIAVSGQPDLVLIDQRLLIDYKTTKAVPTGWRAYVCPETDQLIAEGPYALRRKSLDCPHCTLGSHLTKSIETIGPPRAKPQHALQVSLYRWLLHRHGIEVDRAAILYLDMDTQCRIPIDLLPLSEVERYLRERVALAVQTDLPSILTDPEELWMCDYCPVRQACEERHGGPVGKAAHHQSISMEEP
jgi:hypothetical protein